MLWKVLSLLSPDLSVNQGSFLFRHSGAFRIIFWLTSRPFGICGRLVLSPSEAEAFVDLFFYVGSEKPEVRPAYRYVARLLLAFLFPKSVFEKVLNH